jgi:hypothetical protein
MFSGVQCMLLKNEMLRVEDFKDINLENMIILAKRPLQSSHLVKAA